MIENKQIGAIDGDCGGQVRVWAIDNQVNIDLDSVRYDNIYLTPTQATQLIDLLSKAIKEIEGGE